MRKLAVALALASTALTSPALARDDSWYVGVEGGVMLVEDLSLDIGTNADAATV
ncbi:MAG: flagellar motor protein MotB, partial [Sphingopyxis sp.]